MTYSHTNELGRVWLYDAAAGRYRLAPSHGAGPAKPSAPKPRRNPEKRDVYILDRYAHSAKRAADAAAASIRASTATSRDVVFDKKLGKYVWK